MSQAQNGDMTRRRFLQGVGGAAGAAAVATVAPGGLIQPSAAFPTTPIGNTTVASGYLTRAVQNLMGGEQVEPGSSTPEAIAESWYRTGMYAKEHDETTLWTIWNRLEDARTIANVKAKGVAIQAIENGESESFVLEAAKDEIDQYYAMIQTNLANHWKIQVNKVQTAYTEFDNHADVSSPEDFITVEVEYTDRADDSSDTTNRTEKFHPGVQDRSLTLLDGSEITVPAFVTDFTKGHPGYSDGEYTHEGTWSVDTLQYSTNATYTGHNSLNHFRVAYKIPSANLDGNDTDVQTNWIDFQSGNDPETLSAFEDAVDSRQDPAQTVDVLSWHYGLWMKIIDEQSQMIDNIETWVTNAYGSVQSGEIDVQDLVNNNPTVMASEWSTRYEQTGHLAYAAADLAALGLSFDSDRRMGFELDDGTTFDGTLYVSDDEFEINVGEIVDPSASSANFYAAADTATMERFLADDEFRESVDGGEIKLNVGVVKQTEYVVQTTNDETVTLAWDDWSIPDGSDAAVIEDAESVVYDASGDLDTAVTSVESVLHRYASSESATVLELTDPFKITEAYDVETGEEVDVVAGQGYNAGTTDVDLSWVDDYLEMRENTDDYAEDSGDDGGGGGGPDWDWWADLLNDIGLDGIIPRTIFGVPTWLVLATGGVALVLSR